MNITEFLEARIAEDEAQATKHLPALSSHGLGDYGLRILDECAAKRAIIAKRQWIDQSAGMDDWYSGYSDANYDAMNALAAVYKDHPDYQQEWAA